MIKKSIVSFAVVAAVAAAALIGCGDVSNVTGGRVDEFLGLLNGIKDSSKTEIPKTPAVLDSITAVYNQNGAVVHPTANINTLKPNLKVTAWYDDGQTKTLTPNDYQLIGTLTEVGTSTITVNYNGKSASFNVTVSESPTDPPPDAALIGILAVYDSSKAVYSGTTLDDLKKNLTVTAIYDNGETRVLGDSEYELDGTLSVQSRTIDVTYEYDGRYYYDSFSVRLTPREAAASLYAKAPPISASDSPVDLQYSSGPNIISKVFNYVNSNAPGSYTLVLEGNMDIVGSISVELTEPETKLTIIGLDGEKKIGDASMGSFTIHLGGFLDNKAKPGLELILGKDVTLAGIVNIYAGELTMRDNAKVVGGLVMSGVLVGENTSFTMRDDASVYGATLAIGPAVAVYPNATFLMEGNASVSGNPRPNDAAGGVYLLGAKSFTMRDNASVHSNAGSGVTIDASAKTLFTMQDNASVYGNTGSGVSVKSGAEVVVKGDASIHDNKDGGIRATANGSITLSDRASVYGNIATGNGGGVYLNNGVNFTMNGSASIYGNIAGNGLGGMGLYGNGGGVYVGSNSKFTMTGGTIYGLNAPDASKKNTASDSGAALFLSSGTGTAVYGDNTPIVGSGKGIDITIIGK
jgi:hypothetical protein